MGRALVPRGAEAGHADGIVQYPWRYGALIEFLVRIDVSLPTDMPADQRQELLVAERVRGRELLDRGVLKRIWRVPGRFSNYSLYDVQDATALHDLLSSLPLWPWTTMSVEPLATHPPEAPGDQ
jgi:muconolactone D-isomerase